MPQAIAYNENLSKGWKRYSNAGGIGIGTFAIWLTKYIYSEQLYRWVASGLLEVESKMRKEANYKQLKVIKAKIKKEVQSIEEKQQMNANAA